MKEALLMRDGKIQLYCISIVQYGAMIQKYRINTRGAQQAERRLAMSSLQQKREGTS